MKQASLAVIAVLIVVATGVAQAQQHPNLQRGFAADKVYQFGNVDSVNLFNGNVQISIPIGNALSNDGGMTYGLTLTNNSKLWDFEEVYCNPAAESCKENELGQEYPHWYIRAIPSRRTNAGLGWMVSIGRLISPTDPIMQGIANSYGWWIYESPDGADHVMYGGQGGYFHSKDSTYLRLKVISDFYAEVHHPNGDVHTFKRSTLTESFRLEEMKDAFGNIVSVSYQASSWTITDKFGRTTTVNIIRIGDTQTGYADVVGSIHVPHFDNTPGDGQVPSPTIFSFNYSPTLTTIPRGCSGFIPNEQQFVKVALLNSLGLPDGSSYGFSYNNTTCDTGTLSSAAVPTGGVISWLYGTYVLPSGECDEFLNGSPGVVRRTFTGLRPSEPTAVWTYEPQLAGAMSCELACTSPTFAGSHQFSNTVTTPLGDKTKHHFSVWPNANVGSCNGSYWYEYGKPFKRDVAVSRTLDSIPETLFLSTETFDCPETGICTSPQLRRSTYVRYESDSLELDANWRQAGERTVFHDDGEKYVDIFRRNYAGYGNYKESTHRNDSSEDLRTTTTNFNTQTIGPAEKWILGLYDSVTVKETATIGTSTQTFTENSLFCFDPQTKFLNAQRILHNRTSDSATDVLVRYTQLNGNMLSEEWSGGDGANLSTGTGCNATSATLAPRYRLEYQYASGSLAKSWHANTGFYSLNLTIDSNTGLALSSSDSAGVATSYQYDAMGRLKSVTPLGSAITTYDYVNASGASAPAKVVIKQFGLFGTELTHSEVHYDSFGRVWKELQRMPDGAGSTFESTRETWRNKMGWLDRVSEREITPTNWTVYDAYDPFGRVGTIRAPDNSVTSLTYKGVRETKSTRNISGSNSVSTHLNDSFGRLKQVVENEPNTITTTYGYDAGDRLVSVGMVGPEASQSRNFIYDGRAFLMSETHPETGQISYGLHDARGHARSRSLFNDPWPKLGDLFYTYDAAERLTEVNVRNPADPNNLLYLKRFTFGASAVDGDRSAGKLTSATRFNYGPSETVEVTERFQYGNGDLAGRLSSKITEVKVNSEDRQKFQQSFAYTDLGTLQTLTYPNCVLIACGTSSSNESLIKSVSNSYSQGLLTSIYGTRWTSTVPLASGINYHPSGIMKRVAHGNGVVVEHAPDPHGMSRPRLITFSNATACDPPVITQQPQSVSISPGATTRLNVTASGTGALTYQWYEGVAGNLTSIPKGQNVPWLDVAPSSSTLYWVHITNSCGFVYSTNAYVTITSSTLTAPTNLIATAGSATQVSISWGSVSGASSYQIERKAAGGTLTLIQNVTSTTYLDTVQQDKAYVYRVRAASGSNVSPYSNADLATTVIHDTVAAGTIVLASHFEKLRTAVNAIRSTASLGAASWTSSSDQIIKRAHIVELRDRLTEARSALGLSSIAFTDPGIVAQATVIKAVHVTELREGTR